MRNGEDWTEETVLLAERAIGYTFQDKALLKTCFTHSTFVNNVAHGEESNERLEFLGDAVLQIVVSDFLYRKYRGHGEKQLTQMRKGYVSEEALTPVAEGLGLIEFLRHSGGKDNLKGKTLSDVFEAVTAGIYLDGGIDAARAFLGRVLVYHEVQDFVTRLQERTQEEGQTPSYTEREEEGMFIAEVKALGLRAEGKGKSKQEARADAAKHILEKLKKGSGN